MVHLWCKGEVLGKETRLKPLQGRKESSYLLYDKRAIGINEVDCYPLSDTVGKLNI